MININKKMNDNWLYESHAPAIDIHSSIETDDKKEELSAEMNKDIILHVIG